MSLFGNIQKISLNQTLSSNSGAHPDDVKVVKERLKQNGYYDEPSYGITPHPDKELFDGIKKFQRDNGLSIDGVMKPDGETIHTMNNPVILASNFETPGIPNEKKDYFKEKKHKTPSFDLF